MIYAPPETTFPALLEGAATGILAELTVEIRSFNGATVLVAATDDGILDVGGGSYSKPDVGPSPEDEASYLVTWRRNGVVYANEELRVTFSAPEEWPGGGAAYVTAPEARVRSGLLTEDFPPEDGDEALDALLLSASALVGSLTCRPLVEGQTDPDGCTDCYAEVPDYLVDLAKRAVVMKAEQMQVRTGSAAARRRGIGVGNLQSFSAGPYSESYFGPDQAGKARYLDPDPALHEVLWALATEACKERWLNLWDGTVTGAVGVVAYDYGARPGGYGGGVNGAEYL
jgi:hypothetical protein